MAVEMYLAPNTHAHRINATSMLPTNSSPTTRPREHPQVETMVALVDDRQSL